jgi:hypothetical protein
MLLWHIGVHNIRPARQHFSDELLAVDRISHGLAHPHVVKEAFLAIGTLDPEVEMLPGRCWHSLDRSHASGFQLFQLRQICQRQANGASIVDLVSLELRDLLLDIGQILVDDRSNLWLIKEVRVVDQRCLLARDKPMKVV